MRYQDFLRTEAERELVSRVRDITQTWNLAESRVTTDPVYPPHEHLTELYRHRLMGLAVPKAYGGLGCGLHGNVLVEAFATAEIASACGTTSRWFHNHNEALGLLHTIGTVEQQHRFSRAVIDRHVQFAVNTHDLTVSPQALRLTARRGTGGYVIHGTVDCFAESEDATWRLTVVAVQEHEERRRALLAFIPRNYPGVHLHWSWDLKTPYQHSVSTISYADCFVPDEYILGMPEHSDLVVADRSLWHAFSDVGWAALYTGLAHGAASIGRGHDGAVNGWPEERTATHRPDSQDLEWHVQERALRIETARRFLAHAAIAVETAQQQPSWYSEAVRVAYRAKTFAMETALAITGQHALNQATRRVRDTCQAETYLQNAWTFVLQDAVPVE